MGNRPNDIATIDWRGFEGTEAVFPVCMKSPAVNGRPLRAQIAAASMKVNNLIVVICDSLNRFNAPNVANGKDQSIDLGTSWLEGNIDTIREFFPDVEVLRWERDIRSHPSFSVRLEEVKKLYDTSEAIQTLRDSMSAYYLRSKFTSFERDYERGLATSFNIDNAVQSSADYLDEEFAGDMVYHEITGGLPHIYWGLYVDDHSIFTRESGQDMGFPMTLPVTSKRHGPSLPASSISHVSLNAVKQELILRAA
ncbi:MAG: hypothetical protein AAF988_07450 [Pseudomonadota bacterium]